MLVNQIFLQIQEIKIFQSEVVQIKEEEEVALRCLVTSMLKIKVLKGIMVERMTTVEVQISRTILWIITNPQMEAMPILFMQDHMVRILLNYHEVLSNNNSNSSPMIL